MVGFASDNPLIFADVEGYILEAWCWIRRPHHGQILALVELDPSWEEGPKHFGVVEVVGRDTALPEPQQFASGRFVNRSLFENGIDAMTPGGFAAANNAPLEDIWEYAIKRDEPVP